MLNCGACGNNLSPTKPYATCANCESNLHLKADCSGLQPSTWNAKSRANKEAWVCLECRSSSGMKRKKLDMDSSTEGMNISEERLMEKIEQLFENQRDFIREELSRCDERFEKLETENKLLKKEVTTLRSCIDDMEQYSRRNNVLIEGVPEVKNEEPMKTIHRIAVATGFNLTEQDIDACHRLPGKKGNTKGNLLIIKFCSRIKKTNFLIYCKTKRFKCSIFGGPEEENVYVSEHLTKKTVDLLKLARRLRECNYRVETRDCNIFVKKDGDPRRTKIISKEQIEKILLEEARDG